jgi:hypothetical protein
MTSLDLDTASRFARVALGHITREYPNKLDHVIRGAADLESPRALHPIFYGSFDWHSCVHGYWLLTSLYRTFPALPEAARIREVVDTHFTAANVATELAYLERPSSSTFERPYGWAWLLKLAAELTTHNSDEGKRWSAVLRPLADAFAQRFLSHLPEATYPIRSGTHANSAFALALALDYARATQTNALEHAIRNKACIWYSNDWDCQAWEPSGDDFLSPALMEAECMRRMLPVESFGKWLDSFFPRLPQGEPEALFEPAVPSNRSDGKIAHLDGLNFSRAWCLRNLAAALPERDARRALLRDAAENHLAASLPHVSGDYMGEHWLATFALLALTAG